MSLKRILALAVAGGLLTAGAGSAARATTPTAQQTFNTASYSTRVCGQVGDEIDRPFGADRGLRLSSSAIVVQTGSLPASGPGLPVSQLTGTTDEFGFRFRMFDQNGAAITDASASGACTRLYYHASVRTANGIQAADLAAVQTDAEGWASVRFTRPLQETPASVVATGSTPYRGPGLPMNLVTSAYSTSGFRVRVLDQNGEPVAGQLVRLHYWATVQEVTPNTRAGNQVVTPDEGGFARVSWPQLSGGGVPVSVILTGVSPTAGPDIPVNLLAFNPSADGVSIRALDQRGEPVTTPFRVAFYATKRSLS